MSKTAKGITALLVLIFIGIGVIGLIAIYPNFFVEETNVFDTADVQNIQLTMHSSTIEVFIDPNAKSISVSIRGKKQDVKNTKAGVKNGTLSITGVTNLARSIEVTVIIPEGAVLDYDVNVNSGIVSIRNLDCGSCTIMANSCEVTISNINAANLDIDNDYGTASVYKLVGVKHHIKSNFGTMTITDATGQELIVETQFGRATIQQIDYDTVTPIGDSGIIDIQ